MESNLKCENTGGLATYVQLLESFVLIPRAYLRLLRKNGSMMWSIMPLAILEAEMYEYSDLVKWLGIERISALNPVYEMMVTTVRDRGGEIIEFQPDRLTAVWGITGPVNFVLEAVLAAMEMRESLKQYQDRSPLTCALGLRMGLDQGRVTEMIIGSSTHQSYSVIGPATLQATHLKETASAGDVKVSQTIYDRTNNVVVYEPCYEESDLLKGETQSYLALSVRSGAIAS